MQWPEYFPENCPCEKCQPASELVFRLIENHNPSQRDFKSYRELNPGKAAPDGDECRACGVSVYSDIDHIRRMQRRVNSQRNKRISRGQLTPEFGMIKKTSSRYGNSHLTWWIPFGVSVWTCFELVE